MERSFEACAKKKKKSAFLSVSCLQCSPEIIQYSVAQCACADGVCEIKGSFLAIG